MTALLLAQFKPIVLFLLIGAIIGLSRISGGKAVTTRAKGLRGPHRISSVRP